MSMRRLLPQFRLPAPVLAPWMVLWLGLLSACGGPELQARDLGSIERLHVLGDVWLSSQPGAADLALLRLSGLTRVIDLRSPDEQRGFDERARVEALGLDYTALPWPPGTAPTISGMRALRHALQAGSGPVLIHGASDDRVGAIWYAVRRLDDGLDHASALAEARAVGLQDPIVERLAVLYVEKEQLPIQRPRRADDSAGDSDGTDGVTADARDV